jgi:Flp pilus assembly protein TadG
MCNLFFGFPAGSSIKQMKHSLQGGTQVSRATSNRKLRALIARDKSNRNEEGSVLVELAVALPMLMLLITGVFSFAAAYSNQLILTQAVGSAGQYLQQIRTSTTNPCQDVLTQIENSAPSLTPSSISLTLTLDGKSVPGNSCSGDQSYMIEGAPVTVLATYPCNLHVFSMNFGSSCQLSAQVTEYEY